MGAARRGSSDDSQMRGVANVQLPDFPESRTPSGEKAECEAVARGCNFLPLVPPQHFCPRRDDMSATQNNPPDGQADMPSGTGPRANTTPFPRKTHMGRAGISGMQVTGNFRRPRTRRLRGSQQLSLRQADSRPRRGSSIVEKTAPAAALWRGPVTSYHV